MNNKYIKKQEYKYIVIPEKRMVICECTTEVNWWDLKNGIYTNVPNEWCKNQEDIFKNSNWPIFTVRTVAKAHPDDKFDETLGKRIAKSKANLKVYRKLRLCLFDMITSITKVYSVLKQHSTDLATLILTENNHLIELSK